MKTDNRQSIMLICEQSENSTGNARWLGVLKKIANHVSKTAPVLPSIIVKRFDNVVFCFNNDEEEKQFADHYGEKYSENECGITIGKKANDAMAFLARSVAPSMTVEKYSVQ